MRKIILLGLNELNFEFVQAYIQKGILPNFAKLFKEHGYLETHSEDRYELLEPWIQWVTIHTGKTFSEHQVFRLGDIVNRKDLKQIWEIAEEAGLSVAAVSPFNARNSLKNPAFFLPDPWTATKASGSSALLSLSQGVSSAVNGNAHSKLDFKTALKLLYGAFSFIPITRYLDYLLLVLKIKSKATKVAILDNLLADTFLNLWNKKRPDFSSLFLNAAAHIQHHYMFNSKVYSDNHCSSKRLNNPAWYIEADQDPLAEILIEYDKIIGRLLNTSARLFIATGLHQSPHLERTFYWRIRDHKSFLDKLAISGIKYIEPRMSRDFLIVAEDQDAATEIERRLSALKGIEDKQALFTIDNRGQSLFVELSYPEEITESFLVYDEITGRSFEIYQDVAFVAIKNGEHNGTGYFIDTDEKFEKGSVIELSQVFDRIVGSFARQEKEGEKLQQSAN
jgi:hypothetical protein